MVARDGYTLQDPRGDQLTRITISAGTRFKSGRLCAVLA